MKITSLRQLPLLTLAAMLLSLVIVASASATPFKTVTEPATSVGAYKATLNGAYYAQNEPGLGAFEYGPTEAFGFDTDFKATTYPGFPTWIGMAQGITGLQPETTYYYHFATYTAEEEWVYGKTLTFTTRSAPRLEAASYLANVTAEQSATSPMSLGVEGGALTCPQFGGSATMLAATTGLKITPNWSGGCIALGLNTTVTANGCTEVLRPGDNGDPSGSLDISCPEGKSIDLSIGGGICKISIPAQTGVKAVTALVNTATNPDSVKATYGVSNLTYVKVKDGIACPLNGTGTQTDGTLSGVQTLSAVDSGGKGDDLKIGY